MLTVFGTIIFILVVSVAVLFEYHTVSLLKNVVEKVKKSQMPIEPRNLVSRYGYDNP